MTTGANDTSGGVGFDPAGTTGGSSGGNTGGGSTQVTPPATGSPAGGSGGPASFLETIQDQGLRDYAKNKGWKDFESVVKSTKELETTLSARPAAASAPKDANEYNFKKPENADKIGYSDDFANAMKSIFHKAEAPADLAAKVHDGFVEWSGAAMQAHAQAVQQAQEKAVRESVQSLELAWGAKDTPTFNRNMEMARRAVRMADPELMAELRDVGAVVKDAAGKDVIAKPKIFMALAKMGEGMYSEDNLFGDVPTDKNPFAADTENRAMQGRLLKTDPDKAVQLMRASGRKEFEPLIARYSRK